MQRLAASQQVFDSVSVPLSSSSSSDWFQTYGQPASNTDGQKVLTRVRVVEDGSGANISYDLEGTPDGGTTVYTILADCAGQVVDLAEQTVRVTAVNASAVGAENANAWLVAAPPA